MCPGPSLPVGLGVPASLVARRGKVILFGGYVDGIGYIKQIHSLGKDWEDGWAVEEVELNEGRGGNPSVLLPDTNMLNS